MGIHYLALAFVAVCLSSLPASAQYREFSNKEGAAIVAKILGVKKTATIQGEWKQGKEEAWKDAKKKAFETALNAYQIRSSTIAIKGSMRRVTLVIVWVE